MDLSAEQVCEFFKMYNAESREHEVTKALLKASEERCASFEQRANRSEAAERDANAGRLRTSLEMKNVESTNERFARNDRRLRNQVGELQSRAQALETEVYNLRWEKTARVDTEAELVEENRALRQRGKIDEIELRAHREKRINFAQIVTDAEKRCEQKIEDVKKDCEAKVKAEKEKYEELSAKRDREHKAREEEQQLTIKMQKLTIEAEKATVSDYEEHTAKIEGQLLDLEEHGGENLLKTNRLQATQITKLVAHCVARDLQFSKLKNKVQSLEAELWLLKELNLPAKTSEIAKLTKENEDLESGILNEVVVQDAFEQFIRERDLQIHEKEQQCKFRLRQMAGQIGDLQWQNEKYSCYLQGMEVYPDAMAKSSDQSLSGTGSGSAPNYDDMMDADMMDIDHDSAYGSDFDEDEVL